MTNTLKKKKSRNYTHFHSVIHRSQRWKQYKCPSVDEWIKKMWYMHTMEYYSALKKEILTHAPT